ncbi:glycosyltransferase family 4 protein [Candidatus Methylomicrobium oryzae]|uniref:glycosyltransferase family 4 protein n=1 Tax=Candidatus Methylomicrobium oryzae TaxID=2802053 RepID=UPI001924EAFF|nr:glycosyltransferase family 1 protein [Methylomicrobium sp. RS1]MBL1264619.1 glycosyltransferase family 1 protein [Methylomicrobium sp. RS1]
MRIALITDAWHPQINGVVTTLTHTMEMLHRLGHTVELCAPDRFYTWSCPGYPNVGLAFLCGPRLRPTLQSFKPDAIHLASEGCVGFAARRYCREMGYHYTTSFHTRFPEYFKMRIGLPLWISYGYMRWFHSESTRVMVTTESMRQTLADKGFERMVIWSRGVDTELYRPREKNFLTDKRPIFAYVGRVVVEKNVEDFLKLELPGTQYVIGDGPQRPELESKYPKARFVGFQTGEMLAQYAAAADVMVFPSRTDTFGLVILEALASGVPVAAFPAPGPIDIIGRAPVGVLGADLRQAALDALKLNPADCRRHALNYSWEQSARQFLGHLTPMIRGPHETYFKT